MDGVKVRDMWRAERRTHVGLLRLQYSWEYVASLIFSHSARPLLPVENGVGEMFSTLSELMEVVFTQHRFFGPVGSSDNLKVCRSLVSARAPDSFLWIFSPLRENAVSPVFVVVCSAGLVSALHLLSRSGCIHQVNHGGAPSWACAPGCLLFCEDVNTPAHLRSMSVR